MTDPRDLIVSSDAPEQVMGAMDRLMPNLPPEVSDEFSWIKLRYWQLYGFEGLFERVNNRSVAQILAESTLGDRPKPIASGQMDDIKFELYPAPDEDE